MGCSPLSQFIEHFFQSVSQKFGCRSIGTQTELVRTPELGYSSSIILSKRINRLGTEGLLKKEGVKIEGLNLIFRDIQNVKQRLGHLEQSLLIMQAGWLSAMLNFQKSFFYCCTK